MKYINNSTKINLPSVHLNKRKKVIIIQRQKKNEREKLTEGAQNWPFLILIIFPVLAAATRRSVCHIIRLEIS